MAKSETLPTPGGPAPHGPSVPASALPGARIDADARHDDAPRHVDHASPPANPGRAIGPDNADGAAPRAGRTDGASSFAVPGVPPVPSAADAKPVESAEDAMALRKAREEISALSPETLALLKVELKAAGDGGKQLTAAERERASLLDQIRKSPVLAERHPRAKERSEFLHAPKREYAADHYAKTIEDGGGATHAVPGAPALDAPKKHGLK